MSVGLLAAYVDRGRAPYHSLYRRPDVFGASLKAVAEQIVEADAAVGHSPA